MNKNNKTKELIFDTSLELLRKNHNLTLKAIADKASVNIAAINYYFVDKEHLIENIVSSEIRGAKEHISMLLDNFEKSNNNEQTFVSIMSYLYDFAIKDLGILEYLLNSNNNLADMAILTYIHEVSLDSVFMDKVMRYVRKLSPFYDMDDCKVRYIQMISTFAFPILCELNYIPKNMLYFNSITDEAFRKQYIKQLTKTFFNL